MHEGLFHYAVLFYSISLVSGARINWQPVIRLGYISIVEANDSNVVSFQLRARSVLLPYDTGVTSLEDSLFNTKFKDKFYFQLPNERNEIN